MSKDKARQLRALIMKMMPIYQTKHCPGYIKRRVFRCIQRLTELEGANDQAGKTSAEADVQRERDTGDGENAS